ncbi:hypothetical protein K1719_014934 [Acacia pycnantha]|nr:hypothetical protein K1719_014934 [Acacia pycnantha]
MAEEPHSGVGPRTNTPSHGCTSQFKPPRCGDRRQELQSAIHITRSLRSCSDPSSPLLQGLNYLRDRFCQTLLLTQNHTGGAGNRFGDQNHFGDEGDSSVGGRDHNVGQRELEGDTKMAMLTSQKFTLAYAGLLGGDSSVGGRDHNVGQRELEGDTKMAMLTSQKFTLAYAGLLGVGGVMGYLKGGSQKSILAGGLSASMLYYVYIELPARPVFASSMGLGISGALLGVMGSRFKRTGKVFPAGVVSLLSLVMAGGYLHGIMRSMH